MFAELWTVIEMSNPFLDLLENSRHAVTEARNHLTP